MFIKLRFHFVRPLIAVHQYAKIVKKKTDNGNFLLLSCNMGLEFSCSVFYSFSLIKKSCRSGLG